MGLFSSNKKDDDKSTFTLNNIQPSDGHTHVCTVRVPLTGLLDQTKEEKKFDEVVDSILRQLEDSDHTVVDIKFANANYNGLADDRAMIIYR